MIRPAVQEDAGPVAAVVVAAGMFTAAEVSFMPDLFADALAVPEDGAHGLVVDVLDGNAGGEAPPAVGPVVGVVYWHPVEAADRVVDLTMLAVHPALHGTGRGRAVIQHAQDRSRTAGQRLMVVQTSGTQQYAGTRRFYAALGYTLEATIRDYWAAGDDMVLFRLEL